MSQPLLQVQQSCARRRARGQRVAIARGAASAAIDAADSARRFGDRRNLACAVARAPAAARGRAGIHLVPAS